MKYTIEGFSQVKAVELKLDIADLLILRWVVDFANTDRMVKMQVGNKIYFWLKYEGLLKELPILGITKDGLYRRLMRMVEKGVLEHTTIKQGGTYSMYRLGVAYDSLVSTEDIEGTELNPRGYGIKSVEGTELITEQNTNLLNNKSIKEKSLSKDKEEPAPKKSYADVFCAKENEYIKEALVIFVNYCKGKNYNPKVATVEKFASTLRDIAGTHKDLAIAMVQQSIDRGWKDIYPLKTMYKPYVKKEAVSIPVSKEDKAKNPDGSYVVY